MIIARIRDLEQDQLAIAVGIERSQGQSSDRSTEESVFSVFSLELLAGIYDSFAHVRHMTFAG